MRIPPQRINLLVIATIVFSISFSSSSSFSNAQDETKPQTGTAQKKGSPNRSSSSESKLDNQWKEKFVTAKRVIFLGDSNTHNGEYINQMEATLLAASGTAPEMINLGLPSETCCGLSEPIHPFPRPNVQERLGRALEKTKPDFAFACYGMNDGIYHPFSKERFEAFKKGIESIISAHAEAKVPLVLLTPPPFDSLPMQLSGKLVNADAKEFSWKNIYKNYDSEVIKKYADWMLTIDEPNCLVIDTHSPFTKDLANLRETEKQFTFSNDGVHFDEAGHRVFATIVLEGMGMQTQLTDNKSLLKLVRQRRSISHLAWLSEVGHLRPGVKPGLPLKEAKEKTASISGEIAEELNKAKQ